MADQTTSSTNPIPSTSTSADDTTVQLPQVDLSETNAINSSAALESVAPDNTISDNITTESLPVDKDVPVINEQVAAEEDPFAGLNLVFDKKEEGNIDPSSNIPNNSKENADLPTESKVTGFVDPFLNAGKKGEESSSVASIDQSNGDAAAISDSNENQINLDAMLSAVETNTAEPVGTKTGLNDKKKKIIMIGSGLIGLLILVGTSYFVFTTMFPVETENLVADISGGKGNTGTTTTGAVTGIEDSNPDQNAKPDEYKPQEEVIDTAKDDELPIGANEFGEEDELPLNAPIKKEVPAETTTGTGSTDDLNEDELTDVKPEVSKAIEDLNKKIEGAKQLLTLLRSKPNLEQTKTLAGMIKEIKSLLNKLQNNSFTSFSEEIEKSMIDLGLRFDALTSEIVGN